MSGIAGILNFDGAPLERTILARMAAGIAFRGPDMQSTWTDGSVGLAHTLLRTSAESRLERQPASLAGVWITADARIDARAELIAELGLPSAQLSRPDCELILHAYHHWGEDCVSHLIGDFSFAVWDPRHHKLFCARDHLGVKPFFYTHTKSSFIFSNTLKSIRQHDAVSEIPNEQAIGDFLLFESSQNPSATAFRDIRRLPPGHVLVASMASRDVRPVRYWSLPTESIRYKRTEDYVEKFGNLLTTAVQDRLRTDRAGIFLSGGLDSPTIAAVAASGRSELCAYTAVVDTLYRDEERYYAGLVADALDLPIRFMAVDGYSLYQGWGEAGLPLPEPTHLPLAKIFLDHRLEVSAYARTVLTGHGGDQVFALTSRHFGHLLRRVQLCRLLADGGRYVKEFRSFPRIGVRSGLKNWFRRTAVTDPIPAWLDPDFVLRTRLRSRYEELCHGGKLHPTRPEASEHLQSPSLTAMFETFDPGSTGIPLESAYPYCDTRLVAFLLAIPPLPWFRNKQIARVAMKGRLPELVRLRPKTPVEGDPIGVRIRKREPEWREQIRLALVPELSRYIDLTALPQLSGREAPREIWTAIRPISLGYWLRYTKPRTSVSRGQNRLSEQLLNRSNYGFTTERLSVGI